MYLHDVGNFRKRRLIFEENTWLKVTKNVVGEISQISGVSRGGTSTHVESFVKFTISLKIM